MKGLVTGLSSASALGLSSIPVKCNSYHMGSWLVSAFNAANLCFLVLSFPYSSDYRDVLYCGQVVQEEGEEPSAKIC